MLPYIGYHSIPKRNTTFVLRAIGSLLLSKNGGAVLGLGV